ncbi:nuclear transport factor 2 family protein [Candidatus Bipolaricaulota bacterium]|nr:nuclear transport factor 2 family protein [Candidatus Bipolaricaulota bacterium]
MTPEDFIRAYEYALGTQDWSVVEPLIHPDACVTFSTGSVHKGKPAVQRAFEANFMSIKSEVYAVSNVHWVTKSADIATYLFEFDWSGMIQGQQAHGAGRGTSVLVNEGGKWQLLVEHLGPKTP